MPGFIFLFNSRKGWLMTRCWFHVSFIYAGSPPPRPPSSPPCQSRLCWRVRCQGKVRNGAIAGGGRKVKEGLFQRDKAPCIKLIGMTLWRVENWHCRREKEAILVCCLRERRVCYEDMESSSLIEQLFSKSGQWAPQWVSETFSRSPWSQNCFHGNVMMWSAFFTVLYLNWWL